MINDRFVRSIEMRVLYNEKYPTPSFKEGVAL
jgi:hypothetical protein